MFKKAILLDEAAPVKPKRVGRKKGSKNRPKEDIPHVNRRKNRGEYEFNSGDEDSQVAMNGDDIKKLLNKFLGMFKISFLLFYEKLAKIFKNN